MNSPKNIVPPTAFVPHGLAPVAVGTSLPSLSNHGGPVISAVEVVPIYWGASWSTGTDALLSTDLDAFFDFIVTSKLMDMLAEYGSATPIGHGKRLNSFRLASSEPGNTTATGRKVTDAEIQQALQAWIAAGQVAAVTANTLYFIFLPPAVVCEMAPGESSCTQFCGYHSHISGSSYYAVIPYANCSGCVFPGNFLDTLTEVASHELAEAITDPTLSTWWDNASGNEIGDICNRDGIRLGGYWIQTEWSNKLGKCMI